MNKYTLPNGTLVNKLGIIDQKKLEEAERIITREAEKTLPKFSLNFDGLKKIHQHLFQDVYEWAGQTRTSTLQKDLDSPAFTPPTLIEKYAHQIFTELKDKNHLQNLDKDSFSKEAAHLFGHINNLHPFREGNGRTQRIFIEEVAKQAGYEIDFSEITKERMIQASIEFNQGNPRKMQEIFIESMDKKLIENLRSFNAVLRENRGIDGWNNLFVSHSHSGNEYQGIYVGTDKKTFVMQLQEPSGTIEKNSIIIAKYDEMQFLDVQPKKEGQKVTLNIPALETAKNIENSKNAKIGETYTGKILSVEKDVITQQTAKNRPIIIHETKNLPDIKPEDVGKKLQIFYGANGKGEVLKRYDNGSDKQKDLNLNSDFSKK